MNTDLLRQFEIICNTGVANAGYTSGLCGEWIEERFERLAKQLNIEHSMMIMAIQNR